MTTYNVHIYREMRLKFTDIDADTPEAAASIAAEKRTVEAEACEDCEGESIAAVVDVVGDEDYSQSVSIDFEPERQRKAARTLLTACRMVVDRWEHGDLAEAARTCRDAIAQAEAAAIPSCSTAPGLLAALQAVLPYAENEAYSLEKHKDSPEAEAEAERAWKAIESAQAALAEAAKAAAVTIDFEPELQRQAAQKLLSAVQMAENYLADDLDEADETEMRIFNAICDARAGAAAAGIAQAQAETAAKPVSALLTTATRNTFRAVQHQLQMDNVVDRGLISDAIEEAIGLLDKVEALEAESAGIAPAEADNDVQSLLAARRQIAAIWSVEDVRAVAPNLTDDQCWEVLQQAERRHDAEIGINWSVLICHADTLLGEAAGTSNVEEA